MGNADLDETLTFVRLVICITEHFAKEKIKVENYIGFIRDLSLVERL